MDGCLHRIWIYVFFCWAIGSAVAFADKVNNEWYSPLRTLTMGNAAIGLNDDADSAMFYNPAGLAKIRKNAIEVLNPLVEVGTGDVSLVSGNLLQLGNNASLGKIQPALSNHPGRPSSLGLSVYPNFQAQNFGFGIVGSAHESAYVDPAGTLHYQARYLIVPTLGMSAGFLSGKMKLGVAIHGVNLTENNQSTSTFTNIGYLTKAGQGFGLALDVGTQITFPWAGLPTLGLVARNVGGTSFGTSLLSFSSTAVGQPPLERASYDGGFSFVTRFARTSSFTFDVDYRDILNSSATRTLRHVNLGGELGLTRALYFRTGMSRGYLTAGFGIHGKNGSLELGSYAEELDESGYHSEQDRRVAMQFMRNF